MWAYLRSYKPAIHTEGRSHDRGNCHYDMALWNWLSLLPLHTHYSSNRTYVIVKDGLFQSSSALYIYTHLIHSRFLLLIFLSNTFWLIMVRWSDAATNFFREVLCNRHILARPTMFPQSPVTVQRSFWHTSGYLFKQCCESLPGHTVSYLCAKPWSPARKTPGQRSTDAHMWRH